MGNKVEDLFRYRLPGKELPLEEMLPLLPPRLIQTLLQQGVQTIGGLYEAYRTGIGLDFLENWQLKQIRQAFKVWPHQHAHQARVEASLREKATGQWYVPSWDWQDEDQEDSESEGTRRHWKVVRENILLRATRSLSRASARALCAMRRRSLERLSPSNRTSGRQPDPSCQGN